MADQELKISILGDVAGFERAMQGIQGKLQSVGKAVQGIGAGLSAAFTLPLAGASAAALKFSTDLNKSMANVQSLGVAQDRVEELKASVQRSRHRDGKEHERPADGLYQVVSAYGDTADSAGALELAAKAGAAGLADTQDAINLISAVTKGYGDTSLEAQQKAADLAFTTVQLGQTTFPELAASLGKVVPLAASLGVKQEELQAQMATLTGVTGTAADVSTQLRATYQAILKPTTDMAGAINKVATDLQEQGKLAGGPLVDAWDKAKASLAAMQERVIKMPRRWRLCVPPVKRTRLSTKK